MLEVRDLQVSYGGVVRALRGVSLQVPTGGVVAVLGSNGAGKSTLLRTVSSTLRLHKGAVVGGTVSYDGQTLAGLDTAETVRRGIVQVPEGRRIFGRLTVEENLKAGGLGARDKATRLPQRDTVYDMFPVLAERRHGRAGLLSGGEQQMLAIGRALMASPQLLILDEPSLGLAPKVVGQIGRVIKGINSTGTSVLLVEQNATMALNVAQTAYVLDVGEVVLTGPSDELAKTDDVKRLYLGHAESKGDSVEQSTGGRMRPTGTLSRWTG